MKSIKQQYDELVTMLDYFSKRALELKKQGLNTKLKADGSVVTLVDLGMHKEISTYIKENFGEDSLIISEEGVSDDNSPNYFGKDFWSIDPIDSTVSLVKGENSYTINIAYIQDNLPIIGVIISPETNEMWYGMVGYGAFKKVIGETPIPIHTRKKYGKDNILLASNGQDVPENIVKYLNIKKVLRVASSLKFTYIAEGKADFYLRRKNKACDWDIAAGHALVISAGGWLQTLNEKEEYLFYGVPPYIVPSLITSGDQFTLLDFPDYG